MRDITAGDALGLTVGPMLWNDLYDCLLRLEMPESAFHVAYADDVAMIIRARNRDEVHGILDKVSYGWIGSARPVVGTAEDQDRNPDRQTGSHGRSYVGGGR